MTKNLASVKPVKCYGEVDAGNLSKDGFAEPTSFFTTPCTLLTTARYKKLMDVVKAAQKWDSAWALTEEYREAMRELAEAIKAAEKAGAI